jgi:transcriptional regulator of aromatic amino acid metabolism
MYGRIGCLAVGVALSALTLLGCGQNQSVDRTAQAKAQRPPQTAEHQRVRNSAQSFLVAMQAHQDARACGMMTPKLQHGITFFLERNAEPGNCRTRATHIYSPAKAPGHPGAHIKTIDLNGTEANAIATAPGGVESDIELRRVTGTWKIANF